MFRPAAARRRRYHQSLAEAVRAFEEGKFSLWEYNREINDRQAQAIAEYAAANGYDLGPQPLILGALPDGRHYLLDGQHRLRAGALLGADAAHVEIELVIEQCDDAAALRRLFRLINIGTPVPARYYDEEVEAFVAAAAPAIKRRWAAAYSAAAKTPRPWFSDVSLQHHLAGASCREALMLGLLTPECFIAELEELCRDIDRDYQTAPAAAARRYHTVNAPTVYPRAYDKGFSAGVLIEWGEAVARRIIEKSGRRL